MNIHINTWLAHNYTHAALIQTQLLNVWFPWFDCSTRLYCSGSYLCVVTLLLCSRYYFEILMFGFSSTSDPVSLSCYQLPYESFVVALQSMSYFSICHRCSWFCYRTSCSVVCHLFSLWKIYSFSWWHRVTVMFLLGVEDMHKSLLFRTFFWYNSAAQQKRHTCVFIFCPTFILYPHQVFVSLPKHKNISHRWKQPLWFLDLSNR